MQRPARWLLPNHNSQDVAGLAQALGVGPPAARVLWSRGYRDPQSARDFLTPSLATLRDPFLLRGMDAAIARLECAIRLKEPILLYGDYDVDGTTAIVVLKKAIELAGGSAGFHVPHRLRDGYGMRSDVIDRAAAEGVRLVISVDTGIRAGEVVRHAATLGIDVIITDHHVPEAELPPAIAVLNPNRTDCGYPDKNLCGAGVAFKLAQALLDRLGWPEAKRQRMLESFLKLVAIATVADVVPLIGENRVIVKCGLAGLGAVRNPGLRALLRVAGFGEREIPSAGQVAFRIAPRINAAGRMANAADVIDLFLTDDVERAAALAGELHSLNEERQQTEADIVRAILKECEAVPVTDENAALVMSGENWHRGVVGICASRVVDRFHRPSFVLSEDSVNGEAQGSGRSVPGFDLLAALESMPDLFTRFGGHRQAAGVTLARERVVEFRTRLNAYAAARLSPEDFCAQHEFDGAFTLDEIHEESVRELLSLAPFGFGNRAPLLALLDAEVASAPGIWKEKHLRLRVRQNGRYLSLKAWNFAARAAEFPAGAHIDAAVSFEDDPYSGWSAFLKDARPHSA